MIFISCCLCVYLPSFASFLKHPNYVIKIWDSFWGCAALILWLRSTFTLRQESHLTSQLIQEHSSGASIDFLIVWDEKERKKIPIITSGITCKLPREAASSQRENFRSNSRPLNLIWFHRYSMLSDISCETENSVIFHFSWVFFWS